MARGRAVARILAVVSGGALAALLLLGGGADRSAAQGDPPPAPSWSGTITLAQGDGWGYKAGETPELSPSHFTYDSRRWEIREMGIAGGKIFIDIAGPAGLRYPGGGEFYVSNPGGLREWVYPFSEDLTETGTLREWSPPPRSGDLGTGEWEVGIRPLSPPPRAAENLPTVEAHQCLHLVAGIPVVPAGAPAQCSVLPDMAGYYVPPVGEWTFWTGEGPGDRTAQLPRTPGSPAAGRITRLADAQGAYSEWSSWEVGYGDDSTGDWAGQYAITVVPHRVCFDMDASAPDPVGVDECYGLYPDLVCYPAQRNVMDRTWTIAEVDTLDLRSSPGGDDPCSWGGWEHSRSYRAEAVMVFRVFAHAPLFCSDPRNDGPLGTMMCGDEGNRIPYWDGDASDPHTLRNQAVGAAWGDIEVSDIEGGMLYAGEVPQFFACPVQIVAARVTR